MRIEAIAVGLNPPHDVNVIIEVPLGGQPIKYERARPRMTLNFSSGSRFLVTSLAPPAP